MAPSNQPRARPRKRRSTPLRSHAQQMLASSRRRAARKGVKFSITERDIEIPKVCPLLGLTLKKGTKKGGHDCLRRLLMQRGLRQLRRHREQRLRGESQLGPKQLRLVQSRMLRRDLLGLGL